MLDPTAINVRLAALPAIVAALLTAACSGEPQTAAAPEPSVETALEPQPVPTRRAAPDTGAAERRIASLELQLLEKSAQVDSLQEQLDEARREVVRSMARLQSVASRAEAASGIAEAELALQSMPDRADIRKLTEQASAAFENENWGGALWLANQAKGAALEARGQLAEVDDGSLRPYERSLALPLELETTTGANVRSGPGTGFGVVYTLGPRSRVVAYSSAEQWLRIVDDSGRRGWISQSLIRGRP
jgi:uncharacterized coiled-coil protein SlyX